MATSPQHWRPVSHSVWSPSRPIAGVHARESDTTSSLSADDFETQGDFLSHPPSHARGTQALCDHLAKHH